MLGISELLGVAGFEYFGDVVAGSDVECVLIQNAKSVIELHERFILKNALNCHSDCIKALMELRFPSLPRLPSLYLLK